MEEEEFIGLEKIDKIFYGMGRFGSTALLTLITLATFFLYQTRFSLDPVLNGYANAIGKIAIAISGFVMGYISDVRVHPKLGRRKPYIISGSILLAISFVLLFTPEFFIDITNQFYLFLYEATWLASFNFFYGYLLTPYQAWLPEITRPEERVEVSGYENVFNLVGNIVGTGGSFAIPLLAKSDLTILYYFVVIISIVEILFYLPAYLRIKEPKIYLKQPNIVKDIQIIISNKNYMYWIFARGIISIGLTIVLTVILGFLSDYLALTDIKYLGAALGVMLVILIAFGLWTYMSKVWGIKKSFIASEIVLVIPLSLIVILLFISDKNLQQLLGIILLTTGGIGLSGYWLYNYAILANIIDADTKQRGESRAGSYTGFDSIVLNIFQAIGYVIVGYNFAIFGKVLGYIYWAPIASIFILIGLIVFLKVEPEPV